MKRAYADLHLCANIKDLSRVSLLVGKASALGYNLVSMPFPPGVSEGEIGQIQRICEEFGVRFASRVDLKPRNPEDLLRDLRRLRRRFEIIAVMCESKAVARQAAKDRRVDLLNFPQPDFRRCFFDMAEAELASTCLCYLEIDVKPLLALEGAARIRLLSILRREVETAKAFHVPVVVSSGISETLLMRKPTEMAALTSLFSLDQASAMDAVSMNPMTIVKRNREKLSRHFIAPGVRVVRRGRDC